MIYNKQEWVCKFLKDLSNLTFIDETRLIIYLTYITTEADEVL